MNLELSKTVSNVLIKRLEREISWLEDWSDSYPKNVPEKKFSKKNWPIFWKVFCTWNWLFQRWIHTIWALYSPYFQWYPTLPSFPYLHVFTTLWIFETQEKSRFIKNSLNYLSDHLMNLLKWKYTSSAF